MDQPRFGGAAQPPLSPRPGEGKYSEEALPFAAVENDTKMSELTYVSQTNYCFGQDESRSCQPQRVKEYEDEALQFAKENTMPQLSYINQHNYIVVQNEPLCQTKKDSIENESKVSQSILGSQNNCSVVRGEPSCQSREDSSFQRLMDVLQNLGISAHAERHRLKYERQRETGPRDSNQGKNYADVSYKSQADISITEQAEPYRLKHEKQRETGFRDSNQGKTYADVSYKSQADFSIKAHAERYRLGHESQRETASSGSDDVASSPNQSQANAGDSDLIQEWASMSDKAYAHAREAMADQGGYADVSVSNQGCAGLQQGQSHASATNKAIAHVSMSLQGHAEASYTDKANSREKTQGQTHGNISKQDQAEASSTGQGVYCKNLLLKDKKGQSYLIICDEDDSADLQVVRYHLNCSGNLHFASRESLQSLLRVVPGAVTPLALIHSSARGVRVLMDASLMKRVDRKTTKLFFHPLFPDQQIGLSLEELERFLQHCGVALETLPSLKSYSAGRRYNLSTAASRFKQNAPKGGGIDCNEGGRVEEASTSKDPQVETAKILQQGNEMVNADAFPQYSTHFQELKITVETLPSKTVDNESYLQCRCVYLKDKRENYFLFICHENQKVDFSNLKTQLKPKKKITPLEKEGLSSLLNLEEHRESPFPLVVVKQPRFLVAVADNLYQRNKAVLTFPHSSESGLRVRITLKDLETFVKGADHDLTTIPVKGTLETLLEINTAVDASTSTVTVSTTPEACGSIATTGPPSQPGYEEEPTLNEILGLQEDWNTTQRIQGRLSSELQQRYVEKADLNTTLTLQEEADLNMTLRLEGCPVSILQSSYAGIHRGNIFYRMTAPLKSWVIRYISQLIRFLERHLPNRITAWLQQSAIFGRMINTAANTVASAEMSEQQHEKLSHTRAIQRKVNRENEAKLSKLQELIQKSGISVQMEKMSQTPETYSDTERCRMYFLKSGPGRSYFMIASESEDPSNVGRVDAEIGAARRGIRLATDAEISETFSWKAEESTLSWTQKELTPLALFQMDPSKTSPVKVGVQGDVYSFPDTTVAFDLPSIGVTLTMNYDDLEKKLKMQGYWIIYLP